MIVFNLRHYDDATTDWSNEVYTWQNIDSQIQKDWDEIMEEFGATWWEFEGWIKAEDKCSTKLDEPEVRVQTPTESDANNNTYNEFAPKPQAKPATPFPHPISGSKTGK